jgi:hypothetical protein
VRLSGDVQTTHRLVLQALLIHSFLLLIIPLKILDCQGHKNVSCYIGLQK